MESAIDGRFKAVRVSVDTDRCCGSGNCVLNVPEVFDQRDEDGLVRLLTSSPDPSLHQRVREAALTCPASAINVDDDQGATSP